MAIAKNAIAQKYNTYILHVNNCFQVYIIFGETGRGEKYTVDNYIFQPISSILLLFSYFQLFDKNKPYMKHYWSVKLLLDEAYSSFADQ